MHAYHFFFFFLHPDISALRGQKRFKPFTMWPSWSSMKMHCSHPQIHRSGAVGAKRVCQGRGSWPTNCIVVRWCCRGAQTFPIKQTTAKIPKCRSLDGVKFCSTRLNFTVWLFFCSFCQRRGTLLPTCACVGFILPFGQDGRQCFFEGGGVGKSECPTAHGMGNTRWIQEVLAKLIRFAVIKMLPFGSDLILADGCWWKPYREAEAAWNLIDRNRILVKDWEAKPSIWAPLRFWTPRPLSPPSSPSTIFFVHDIPLWVLGGGRKWFQKVIENYPGASLDHHSATFIRANSVSVVQQLRFLRWWQAKLSRAKISVSWWDANLAIHLDLFLLTKGSTKGYLEYSTPSGKQVYDVHDIWL